MLWRCKGLRNVLTSSTAKTLVRLRRMSIGSCHRVAEIVVDDDEGDKGSQKLLLRHKLRLQIPFFGCINCELLPQYEDFLRRRINHAH
ncbi:hypothetical protein CUMW_286980, partial [Citrus unshiu]